MPSDLNFEALGEKTKVTGPNGKLLSLLHLLPTAEKYIDYLLVPGTTVVVRSQVEQLLSAPSSNEPSTDHTTLRQRIAADCATPSINMVVAGLL